MGFPGFLKKVFGGGDADDAELRAARARHGIIVDEGDNKENKPAKEPFDPWEEISNARNSFFLGNWATRKYKVVGEDKVKAQLEALEKKREEEKKGRG